MSQARVLNGFVQTREKGQGLMADAAATGEETPSPSAPNAAGDQMPGIADRIRARMHELTPSERRVARALLAGPPTVGLESSARLAEVAGVSGPTVSRFVQRVGFENYAAFQQAMHADIADRVMSPVEVYRRHHAQPGIEGVLSATSTALSAAVGATVRDLSPAELDRATALLSDGRRRIRVVGGWFSQVLADHLAALLREFRAGVSAVPPTASERAAAIAEVARRDVVVVFDFRRYERDTLELARAVRAAGASIVLFTDPWLSPVAEIADATLPAQVIGPGPFETLTPTLALVETLMTSVANVLGEAGQRRFESFGAIADRWVRPWPVLAPDSPEG
jgi:DNA-binding MurR/RpiR family transcriptional regulator